MRVATPAKQEAARAPSACQLGDLFKLLGESYVLDILYLVTHEPRPRRFVEIQRELKISPNTLTARLQDLVQAGLLNRTAYNEIPPRVEYQATRKATEFHPAFLSLVDWAARNDLRAEQVTAKV